MKRILVLIAVLVFAAGSANAEGTVLGVKAGLNLANIWGDDTDIGTVSPGMRLGFGGGMFLAYAITDNFIIQPEMMFMMKGCKWEEDPATLTAKLNYLDFNFLGKFAIATEGNLDPFLFFGPQVGILMSAKWKAELGTAEEEVDVKDAYKSFDFGLVIGAGFDYVLESGRITFDARYTLGMTNIIDASGVDQKNSGIMFLVGYGFDL